MEGQEKVESSPQGFRWERGTSASNSPLLPLGGKGKVRLELGGPASEPQPATLEPLPPPPKGANGNFRPSTSAPPPLPPTDAPGISKGWNDPPPSVFTTAEVRPTALAARRRNRFSRFQGVAHTTGVEKPAMENAEAAQPPLVPTLQPQPPIKIYNPATAATAATQEAVQDGNE